MPTPTISRLRIPGELRTKLAPPTYMKNICGFCATGAHDYCKRGFRSGDGHMMLCPCQDHRPAEAANDIRCTECGNDDIDELDEKLWFCLERPDCDARIEARLATNPTIQMIREVTERAEDKKAAEPKKQRSNGQRPSSGKCLCCGEPTAGGLFLPGHDARLVARYGKQVEDGMDPIEALAEFTALGVSPALQGKLQRKLEKL